MIYFKYNNLADSVYPSLVVKRIFFTKAKIISDPKL